MQDVLDLINEEVEISSNEGKYKKELQQKCAQLVPELLEIIRWAEGHHSKKTINLADINEYKKYNVGDLEISYAPGIEAYYINFSKEIYRGAVKHTKNFLNINSKFQLINLDFNRHKEIHGIEIVR